MTEKKVLVAPLNWGLGHATRVVPIIDQLLKHHFRVILAADGQALDLLQKEFPQIPCLRLSDIHMVYAKKHVFLKIFIQIPKLIVQSIIEHFRLKALLKKHPVDMIISDNRVGIWSRGTYNIFISHQLRLKLPERLSFLSFIYPAVLKWCLKPFAECWVPDLPGEKNFSGELSHDLSRFVPVNYVGVLSRFSRYLSGQPQERHYDLLFILSGPEPQRTLFEELILQQIEGQSYRVALVRGVEYGEIHRANVDSYGLVQARELFDLIRRSEMVVCRAGYSSIMDLYVAGAQAVLVPTPGQTEQEYLAGYLARKKYFYSLEQRDFNLDRALKHAREFSPPAYTHDEKEILEREISRLKSAAL
ncbi:MAG: glycosyltransferase [Bacteroidales bacterium]|jgi:UDP:flavonoid glycosyltransferase YjiC (YdhE family)|nr:glycosyltransferase [Bacteroidales bacterium]